MKIKSKLGFTIIELLVVISVIGILAGLILARLGTAEKSGRDTRRKSDLNQYRIALENYAVKANGTYLSLVLGDASSTLCTTLGTSYISTCPQDPRQDGASWFYRYQSNGSGGATATQYILWAKLESSGYWYICANGQASAKTTPPEASDCY